MPEQVAGCSGTWLAGSESGGFMSPIEVLLGERFIGRLGGLPPGAFRVVDPLVGVTQDGRGLRLGVVAPRLLLLGQEIRTMLDPLLVGWLGHDLQITIQTPLMPP